MTEENVKNRRPLKSRTTWWAKVLLALVSRTPLSPNAISVLGIFFSIGGFASYVYVGCFEGHPAWLLAAAVCIQTRLLCNLLDGLVAVEAGKAGPTGILYNEAPDRLEDVLFLVGAGLASQLFFWGLQLGWLCSALALGTAYVRALGGSFGLTQDFCGPMAKQQRMFILTVASIGAWVEALVLGTHWFLGGGLVIIALGSFLTIVRRLLRISVQLKARP